MTYDLYVPFYDQVWCDSGLGREQKHTSVQLSWVYAKKHKLHPASVKLQKHGEQKPAEPQLDVMCALHNSLWR